MVEIVWQKSVLVGEQSEESVKAAARFVGSAAASCKSIVLGLANRLAVETVEEVVVVPDTPSYY